MGDRIPYSLIFQDCREIGWNVHDEEEVGEPLADLIGIHLGEDLHRKPATIHTDIFEISILYGSFRVEKDAIAQQNPWQKRPENVAK